MTDEEHEEPEVTVVCPECDTETAVPFSKLESAISNHNERLHDGADVAGVDPEFLDAFQDVVADDLELR